MEHYLKKSVSNGNPREQALIRKWWYEEKHSEGLLVWEYCLEGRYLDAVWFSSAEKHGAERSGLNAPATFPVNGREVILCEAKITLSPELVGQALVYRQFALWAGAQVRETIVFAEKASPTMIRVAHELALTVKVGI